jgi:hypothetical protein
VDLLERKLAAVRRREAAGDTGAGADAGGVALEALANTGAQGALERLGPGAGCRGWVQAACGRRIAPRARPSWGWGHGLGLLQARKDASRPPSRKSPAPLSSRDPFLPAPLPGPRSTRAEMERARAIARLGLAVVEELPRALLVDAVQVKGWGCRPRPQTTAAATLPARAGPPRCAVPVGKGSEAA